MNLKESTKSQVTNRTDWLHQAERAKREVAALPKAIQELGGSADINYSGTLQLALHGGDKTMQVLLDAGAEFDKPEMANFNGQFRANGHLGDAGIVVYNLSVPPQCHVEKEAYTAYRYKAVCEEE